MDVIYFIKIGGYNKCHCFGIVTTMAIVTTSNCNKVGNIYIKKHVNIWDPRMSTVTLQTNIVLILISNFRLVLNALCFLLGDSPASEIYMPTFRNTLFHLHRQVGACRMN